MKKFKMVREKVSKFNDWVAIHATVIFGSMAITYMFFFYGFLPLFFPSQEVNLLYWSNTVQLWSLPLLMTGSNLLGRKVEKRAQEDHDALMAELADMKIRHALQEETLAELKQMHEEDREWRKHVNKRK